MKQHPKTKVNEGTVLLVVYEQTVRDLLARTLRTKGHKVTACSVGLEGIRRFRKGKGKFDLVMIDSHLPRMTGLGVVKKIKMISGAVPVILIKGWNKRLDATELKNYGVDLVISKPFCIDDTLTLVERALLCRY